MPSKSQPEAVSKLPSGAWRKRISVASSSLNRVVTSEAPAL